MVGVDPNGAKGAAARQLRTDVRYLGALEVSHGPWSHYEAATGDIVVTFDASSEVDGVVIGQMVRALRDGAQFVKGTRLSHGAPETHIPLRQRAANLVLSSYFQLVGGSSYSDPTCSVWTFWKDEAALLQDAEQSIGARLFGAATATNTRALYAGLRIVEIPLGAVNGDNAGAPRWKTVPVPRVSVIIPTLNEARNLPHVLPKIPNWVHEVILVDGNSTDDTIEVAQRVLPGIRIAYQQGRGKGDALRAGFEAATGEIIVMLDADGSTDPGEIGRFVRELREGAHFVKGSRFMQGAGTADMPLYRKLGNWTFVYMVRLLFGGRYSDLCYGYNAFWRSALPELELDGTGFEIETMMNVRALRRGLKISEVRSFEAERIHGTSNLRTIPDGWRVLRTIVREGIDHYLRRRSK